MYILQRLGIVLYIFLVSRPKLEQIGIFPRKVALKDNNSLSHSISR